MYHILSSFKAITNQYLKPPLEVQFYIVLVEFLLRILWTLSNTQTFIECFILNIISNISNVFIVVLILPEDAKQDAMYHAISLIIVAISITIVSYFNEKKNKQNFYYSFTIEENSKYFENILQNMNSGLISVKKGIVYFNNFCYQYFSKNINDFNNANDLNNDNNDYKIINVNTLPNEAKEIDLRLLSNINTDSINDENIKKITIGMKNEISSNELTNLECLNIMKKYIRQIPKNPNFFYLFEISLPASKIKEESHFECNIKYNEDDDQLDIILNDVSRPRLLSQQLTEFKYKTLFLSKVAHEFKNPLICITELVNQQIEDLDPKLAENVKKIEKFSIIKSFSDYLCILIRDLNYFNEKLSEIKDIALNLNSVDLEDVISFCNNIAKILIIKSNKTKYIQFKCNKDIDLPKFIFTDEWRLKQILINIISNAVKFTFSGVIIFEITNVELDNLQHIRFSVSDTGIGLSKENIEKFFKSKTDDYIIRLDGTFGFGLTISSEILKLLKSKIEINSKMNEGSTFSFLLSNSIDISELPTVKKIILNPDFDMILEPDENSKNSDDNSKNSEIIDLNLSSSSITQELNEITIIKSNLNEDEKISNFGPTSTEVPYQNTNKLSLLYKHNGNDLVKRNFLSDSNLKITHKNNGSFNIFGIQDFILTKDKQNQKSINSSNNSFINPFDELLNTKYINIILADDDIFPRQSTIRILKRISTSLNIPINIIELDDGAEILITVFKSIVNGIRISMILSDENMIFLNGTSCGKMLKEIQSKRKLSPIPFYLVTSYGKEVFENNIYEFIEERLNKPIQHDTAEKLILKFSNRNID